MSKKKVEFVASFRTDYTFTEEQILKNAAEWGIDITSGTDEENEKAISGVVEALGRMCHNSNVNERSIMDLPPITLDIVVTMNEYEEEETEKEE